MTKLRIIANPKLQFLSLEQLREIVANVAVCSDCNVHPVTFSDVPPADTSIPWQPLDACGGEPVGVLKRFRNGAWV